MVQSKLAAVSRKRHTTRHSGVLGVRNIGPAQLVFIDTPGFLKQSKHVTKNENLTRDLVTSAKAGLWSADTSLVVIDAAKDWDKNVTVAKSVETLMQQAAESSKGNFSIVLNKVDLVHPKTKLLDLALVVSELADNVVATLNLYDDDDSDDTNITDGDPSNAMTDDSTTFENIQNPVFMVSALENDGVDDILKMLARKAKPGKWEIAQGHVTELTPLERATEIIREKVFRCVHREVPHHIKMVNRLFKVYKRKSQSSSAGSSSDDEEQIERMLHMEQDMIVKSKSHARILQGKNMSAIRRIESAAQKDMEEVLGMKVNLRLHIRLMKSQHLGDDLFDEDDDNFNPYAM